ncbi:YtxH domain-containing protein [Hymenobacter pini]|uniref:YtxH domain-containing protein n=1 Tax=Hymenobacter pini TaxID=2880879 RepID=UPI001CF54344|nr:YtxH domain-containing protein [Hymenobacter pini]MCA8829071.1 YtxH domain-containing protein [Hymenobacter pini]
MQDTKGKVIFSLLAGATAGIVAGLLLAPETGEEARANLKKSASRFGGDLNKLLQEGKNRLDALKGQAPADSEQHVADRSAADDLLRSMNGPAGPQTSEAGRTDEADSDYDGMGGDSRHHPGYRS